jgi:hypothetical protein
MSSGWATRARIARRLSRTGQDELLLSELGELSDYASKIKQFHEDSSIDRRTIAIGADIESHWYEAIINPNEEFAHLMWQNIAQIKMWYDLLLNGGTEQDPKTVLTYMQLPCNFIMELISDATKEFTFINNLDLFYFENFYLTENVLTRYPDIRYSAIDNVDIISKQTENQYDLVRATGFGIHGISTEMLAGLMDSVKIGGSFILSDASDYGMLYTGADAEITSSFWDYGKYICQREDFISYHLPYDVGLVVAKRIA